MATLLTLPPEVLERIVFFLNLNEQHMFMQAHPTFRNVVRGSMKRRNDRKEIIRRWGLLDGVKEDSCLTSHISNRGNFVLEVNGSLYRFTYSTLILFTNTIHRASLTINVAATPRLIRTVTFPPCSSRYIVEFIRNKTEHPSQYYFLHEEGHNYALVDEHMISLVNGQYICRMPVKLAFPFELACPIREVFTNFFIGVRFNRICVYRVNERSVEMVVDATVLRGDKDARLVSALVDALGEIYAVTTITDDVAITTMKVPQFVSDGPQDVHTILLSRLLGADENATFRKMLRSSVTGWETFRARIMRYDDHYYLRMEFVDVRKRLPQVVLVDIGRQELIFTWIFGERVATDVVLTMTVRK